MIINTCTVNILAIHTGQYTGHYLLNNNEQVNKNIPRRRTTTTNHAYFLISSTRKFLNFVRTSFFVLPSLILKSCRKRLDRTSTCSF